MPKSSSPTKRIPCPTSNCTYGPFIKKSNLTRHLQKNNCGTPPIRGRRLDLMAIADDRLDGLLSCYNALPDNHPFKPIGLAIFKHFSALPEKPRIPLVGQSIYDAFLGEPNWTHILRDIILTPETRFFDGVDQAMDDSVDAAFYISQLHNLVKDVEPRPLAASFVVNAPLGVNSCQPRFHAFLKQSLFEANHVNDSPMLTCVVSPAGYITSPHIDQATLGNVIVQLLGLKLWICWPTTPYNLKILEGSHLLTGAISESRIIRLQNPQFTVLSPGHSIYMQPNTIHAVLSLTNSVVVGYPVARKIEIPAALIGFRWQIQLFKNRLSIKNKNTPLKGAEELRLEIIIWKRLQTNHPRNLEIRNFISTMQTELHALNLRLT